MATQDSSLYLALGPEADVMRAPPQAGEAERPPLPGDSLPGNGAGPGGTRGGSSQQVPVFDLLSSGPLPALAPPATKTLDKLAAERASQQTTRGGKLGLWLAGDALMCACPDCGAPMTVRTWLMVADCWNCGTSIELSEEQEREANRLLGAAEGRQAKASGNGAPVSGGVGQAPAARPPEHGSQSDRVAPSKSPAAGASPTAGNKSASPSPGPSSPASSSLKQQWAENAPAAKPRQSAAPHQERPAADRTNGVRPAGAPAGRSTTAPRRSRTTAAVADTRRRIRRLTTVSMVRAWINDALRMTPAWLISAVLHFVFLVILALIPLTDDDNGPQIVLSTNVSKDRAEGDVVQLDPQDDAQFDLPVPADLDRTDPKVKQALMRANQDARELRVDPDAPEPLRPKLNTVKDQIGSPSVQRTLAARDPRVRVEMVEREGGTTFTEAAVARALRWLARQQNKDGGWSLHGGASDEAATALALLPFLGAGQTHLNGIYKNEVSAGLRWLVEHQGDDGDLRFRFKNSNNGMYAQGQGAIVLCEAFAMEGDEHLRAPAQKAIDFIVKAQHPAGGWRYRPGQAGDTSVLGWQLMALQSARVAGLTVPDSTFSLAGQYLDSASSRGGALYGYQPRRSPTETMTAEGLLCRMYNGWTWERPELLEGVDWLADGHLPDKNRPNVYYWYYGTQVFHHVGGRQWERWNQRMRDILVLSQDNSGRDAGSWPTRGQHDGAGGRIYTTSLSTCTLEVYYRHLPIFRQIKLD